MATVSFEGFSPNVDGNSGYEKPIYPQGRFLSQPNPPGRQTIRL